MVKLVVLYTVLAFAVVVFGQGYGGGGGGGGGNGNGGNGGGGNGGGGNGDGGGIGVRSLQACPSSRVRSPAVKNRQGQSCTCNDRIAQRIRLHPQLARRLSRFIWLCKTESNLNIGPLPTQRDPSITVSPINSAGFGNFGSHGGFGGANVDDENVQNEIGTRDLETGQQLEYETGDLDEETQTDEIGNDEAVVQEVN